jgi:hypothetical protein
MGAKFDTKIRNYVFSRQASRLSLPAGVEFVNEPLQSLLLCEMGMSRSMLKFAGGSGDIITPIGFLTSIAERTAA